jgi:hypothetical protein
MTVKELEGLAKVDRRPGETKTISLALNRRLFLYPRRQDVLDRHSRQFRDFDGSFLGKIELKGG